MDMVDGIGASGFNIPDGMRRCFTGSVYKCNKGWIGTQVDNIAENTQVTDSLTIGGCNKTYWPEPT
jgi:hypothetical protein